MKRGTVWLIIAIVIGFGIELATNSVGNDNALLRLGALPDDGELHGEFWRLATYSFLHFSWVHLTLNLSLLWWIGRIVEQQIGTARGAPVYFVSVLLSAGVILLVHNWNPKEGVTVGASGGVFGLLGAALVISYRRNTSEQLRKWLWLVLLIAFAVSFLPDISMSGHIGGIIGGIIVASLLKAQGNENSPAF